MIDRSERRMRIAAADRMRLSGKSPVPRQIPRHQRDPCKSPCGRDIGRINDDAANDGNPDRSRFTLLPTLAEVVEKTPRQNTSLELASDPRPFWKKMVFGP